MQSGDTQMNRQGAETRPGKENKQWHNQIMDYACSAAKSTVL